MPDVPGTTNYPASLDSAISLLQAANNAATTLSAPATNSDVILTVASTADFPSNGALSIEGEVIFYTGTTSTTFTGCLRGQDGTVAAAHDSGAAVQGLIVAAHHNVLTSALIAAETKLGSGASVPSSGTVLQGTGTGTSAWMALSPGGSSDYILIVDQKAQNTNGGTFSAGAWRTRDLNTELVDTGGHASVSANQVTLAAGTYRFEAIAPADRVNRHQMRLYNVTDSSVIQMGMCAFAKAGYDVVTPGFVAGQFTIGSSKTIRVEHRAENNGTFGLACNWGDEIYTILQLWKVA